jgi:dipeptidyl-peptidase 4
MRFLLVGLLALWTVGCATVGATKHRIESNGLVIAEPGFLEEYAATRRYSLGHPTNISIAPNGQSVFFLRSGPTSFVHDLYEFDVRAGTERVIATAEQLLAGEEEELSDEERARRERMRLAASGITSYRLSNDGSKILIPLSGRLFIHDHESGATHELHGGNGFPIDPRFSPDGRYVSCVRNGDIYIIDIESGEERALTTGANGSISHGLAEFVAQEEMGRMEGYWWSPDSRFLAYQQTDTSEVETLYIMDAMNPAREPSGQPYPRVGGTNAHVRLGVASIDGGPTVWVQWDDKRFPYLATVKWKRHAPLTIVVQNRAQSESLVLAVDAEDGSTREIFTERDDAWINLDQSVPHWLNDFGAFLWTTERNGTWQLELRASTGELLHAVTQIDFRFDELISVDDRTGAAYISGGPDPRQRHLYRVDLARPSEMPKLLTRQPGMHSAVFGKDHSHYVHTIQLFDRQPEWIVRSADGTEVGRLQSVAKTPPFQPNIEYVTIGRDPSFHAMVIRPRNFDPNRKYPVINYVYGGPHVQMVNLAPRGALLSQWLADHGFIVVSIDGRGTPGRGREWERVVKGDLIDVPLADQASTMQALGRRFPEMDMSRVGIYGWSFGGYFSAMAVMRRPDVFHAGVAGAPVCDWRDYDTHYTERYMGLIEENRAGYDAASVLTYCPELNRPLLIIHGTADDNVYFMHALKMSNALFRAGRHHEFLPLSDFTHMVADPLVAKRLNERIRDFFVRHLVEDTNRR